MHCQPRHGACRCLHVSGCFVGGFLEEWDATPTALRLLFSSVPHGARFLIRAPNTVEEFS